MHQKVCAREKSQGEAKAKQYSMKNEQKNVPSTDELC